MIWLMILVFEPCSLRAMTESQNMANFRVCSSQLADKLHIRHNLSVLRVRGARSRLLPTNPGKSRPGSAYISKDSLKTTERALTAALAHALTTS